MHTSLHDSSGNVLYTHRTSFMIPRMMFSAHITSYYDSTDDVLGSLPTGQTIQQIITTRTTHQGYYSRRAQMFSRHKSYDSSDDPMCTHRTTAYDSEIILCNQITAW